MCNFSGVTALMLCWIRAQAHKDLGFTGCGKIRKTVPQGLKPDVFSISYGPTKVVP
jgi:hypothetical protein